MPLSFVLPPRHGIKRHEQDGGTRIAKYQLCMHIGTVFSVISSYSAQNAKSNSPGDPTNILLAIGLVLIGTCLQRRHQLGTHAILTGLLPTENTCKDTA